MRQFHGKTYIYHHWNHGPREIGVVKGLGDVWIVGFLAKNSAHRIKSTYLPPMEDPDQLQTRLDQWALDRGLSTSSGVVNG